jgi:hypothetical protein
MSDVWVPNPTAPAAQSQDAVRCATCNAPYRPRLTAGSCPVCDTPAPEGSVRGSRFTISPDDRLMGIVVVATLLNVLLLGLLALAAHS